MKIFLAGNVTVQREREFLLEERYGDYFHFITMVKIESFMTSLSIG